MMKINKYINLVKSNRAVKLFKNKAWILTVLFFVTVLGFSFKVWYECVLNPEPSEDVVSQISQDKKNYERKVSKIEKIINRIEERKKRFENADIDFNQDKSYFKKQEIEGVNAPEASGSGSAPEPSPSSSSGIRPIQ